MRWKISLKEVYRQAAQAFLARVRLCTGKAGGY
jgi:hypothetical protein